MKVGDEQIDDQSIKSPPNKQRFVLQHVWKTGGSEFCRLVRANGWTTPPSHNCFLNIKHGWPMADYDMIANERPMMLSIPDRKPKVDYMNETDDEIEVHNVKWITILRHPYSRSLSHYYHMFQFNKTELFSLPAFLTNTVPPYAYFHKFVPNQQTRWHCGRRECNQAKIGPEALIYAMANLDLFDVVLILEDMKDPNSCTRLQMRHVLNLTKIEIMEDLRKSNSSTQLTKSLFRRPNADWYDKVMPSLDHLGHYNGTSAWGQGSQVMAALGLHNDLDLQLFGYARKLCNLRGLAIQEKLARENETSFGQTPQNRFALTKNPTGDKFQSTLLKPKNITLLVPSAVTDWTDAAIPQAIPSGVTTLQVSLLVVVSVWMLLLPSLRRFRIKLRRTVS